MKKHFLLIIIMLLSGCSGRANISSNAAEKIAMEDVGVPADYCETVLSHENGLEVYRVSVVCREETAVYIIDAASGGILNKKK